MRNTLISIVAGTAVVALSTAGTFAADLPSRAPPPVFAPVPIFTWTGFYAGLNAGWGWREDNEETVFLTPGLGTPGLAGTLVFPGNGDGGFTGGGQIGYNWQFNSFVIGAEADIQWADTGNVGNAVFLPGGGFAGSFVPGVLIDDTPEWWGSLRARLGFAFDRVLIYGTGGLAYTEDNAGWAVGGGVEWALPVNWFGSSAVTFGLEGLWVSIDRSDDNGFVDGFGNRFVGTFTPVGGPTVDVFAPGFANDENEFFIARAKLNFKF